MEKLWMSYEWAIRRIEMSIRTKMLRCRALEEETAALLCITGRRMARCVQCVYSSHTFRLDRGVSEALPSCISRHRNDHSAKVATMPRAERRDRSELWSSGRRITRCVHWIESQTPFARSCRQRRWRYPEAGWRTDRCRSCTDHRHAAPSGTGAQGLIPRNEVCDEVVTRQSLTGTVLASRDPAPGQFLCSQLKEYTAG